MPDDRQQSTPWDAHAPRRFWVELRDFAEGLTLHTQKGNAIKAGSLLTAMQIAFREVKLSDAVAEQLYALLDEVREIDRAEG